MKNFAETQYTRVLGLKGAAEQRVEDTLNIMKGIVYQTFMFSLTSGLLILISIFMYGSFYFAFVPSPIHQGPVHLTFNPCHTEPGKCGFLNATIQMSDRNPVLMTGQSYTVSLSLEMPESEVNKNLGMFMSCAQLLSRESKVSKSACRSAMMKYRSESLRTLELYFTWPGLITGYVDEKQYVHIPLFDDYMDDPLNPAVKIHFQVMSRYAEVYSASYRIDAQFSGLRYLMFYYPVTAALVGISLNLFILAAVFVLSWYRFFAISPDSNNSDNDYIDPFTLSESEDEDHKADSEGEKEFVLSEALEELDQQQQKLDQEDEYQNPDFTSHTAF